MSLDNTNMFTELSAQDNGDEKKIWIRNISLSLLIHCFFIIILILIFSINQNRAKINPVFFYIETKDYEKPSNVIKDETTNEKMERNIQGLSNLKTEDKSINFVSLSNLKADTTNLDQLYKESSLNLSIKYPNGWTFLDQNRNRKLDGVTFWAANVSYSPPPYIHLEVVDRYLFNEKRYKHQIKLNDCTAFYNDPEELAGQVNQSFYLHTDSDEDYIIKLIINGRQNFDSFQPEFLAILKSFRIGESFF
jgi:hypothetical protein